MTLTPPSALYVDNGVVYEDTGTGYDYPVRPAFDGPLGDLLFRIAELAVSIDMGAEYVAETYAEAGMSFVHGGGHRSDASMFANDAVRPARLRLAEEEAALAALRDELDDRFPVHGPPTPCVWAHRGNCSDDRFDVFHGYNRPTVICGYHELRFGVNGTGPEPF